MENIKNISKALMEFQAEVPTIPKTKEGYNYKYADLPSILGVINPLLHKNGLILTQLLGNSENKLSVRTILIHSESGETLESIVSHDVSEKTKMTSIQHAGSVSTYLRRYSIAAMLNIVTDEDTDGSLERNIRKSQEKTVTKKQAAEIRDMLERSGGSYEKFIEWLEKWFDMPINSIEEIPRGGFGGVKGKLEQKIFAKNKSKKKVADRRDFIKDFKALAFDAWGPEEEIFNINVVEFCANNNVVYSNMTQSEAKHLTEKLEKMLGLDGEKKGV